MTPLLESLAPGCRRLYENGETIRAVCTKVGLVPSQVHAILDELGVSRKPTGRRKLTPADPRVARAMELYVAGETFRQIADALDVSTSQVFRFVQRGQGK